MIALVLAIFATFWDQRPQYLRKMESQPKHWLQWAGSGGDNGYGVKHDQAYSWGFHEGDDDQEDRLHVGLDGGEL